jgi:hypothetical protein
MKANTHVSSSVTDVVDILDVNYDDLFCDYNTLTTVTATDEADLCPVTAIMCAIEQFLPRIVAPVARIEWLV